MIKTIPLNRLVASPRNVRRSTDPQADAELKADIETRGILQNLVVTSVRKPRGCFAVEAGERRRQALQRLADEGKLAADHPICCLLIDGAAAEEASLAENFQRLAMNPADECLAFGKLVEQGSDPESVARRFGVTVRFVEGRLRLASLAPIVFAALGAGEISLDVAKAYAATPDRERQEWVFEQLRGGYSAGHPDSIRRMMTQATVAAGDRRALFVGEEAYLAAGGRIEQDLFSEGSDARWIDVVLVERLALEKLQGLADAFAVERGLAFVRARLDSWAGYPATEGLRSIPLERPPLSEKEAAALEAAYSEIDSLSELVDDAENVSPDGAETEARIAELREQIDCLVLRDPLIPDELAGKVGALLLLDQKGVPKLHSTYFVEAAPAEGEADKSLSPVTSAAAQPAAAPPRSARLSRRLLDELAMQRRDILAAHIATDPGFALDLAIFLIADQSQHRYERRGSSLIAMAPADPIAGFEAPEARATAALSDAGAKLIRSWTEGEGAGERFTAFRELSGEDRAAWLAYCLARTLTASTNAEGERACAFHDELGAMLGIDVARWWRPTGANFLDRVPKAMMLEALRDVGGADLARTYAGCRKAELAQACERIFAGDFIAGEDTKKTAQDWLPHAMRFAATGDESADPETPPWEDVSAAPEQPVQHLEAA